MGVSSCPAGAQQPSSKAEKRAETARKHALKCNKNRVKAGLDEGLPSLSVSHLVYTENPYRYNKFQ